MESCQTFDPSPLDAAGLNRQAVFNIPDLPAALAAALGRACPDFPAFTQVILIGHGGRRLWEAVREAGMAGEHPIDQFAVRTVELWFSACQPANRYRILYPGSEAIGLQQLGQAAGWHQPSPFMIGIDPHWGSWYAYRAVVVADTRFPPSPPLAFSSPCASCPERDCLAACPAAALGDGGFNLDRCMAWRLSPESSCRHTCLARLACPVGVEHRYGEDQLHHTYSRSLAALARYCRERPEQ